MGLTPTRPSLTHTRPSLTHTRPYLTLADVRAECHHGYKWRCSHGYREEYHYFYRYRHRRGYRLYRPYGYRPLHSVDYYHSLCLMTADGGSRPRHVPRDRWSPEASVHWRR